MNYTDIINQLFQQHLGRSPSPAEINGFGQAMQQGIIDPVGLQLFIQGSAQYQQQQAQQYSQAYNQQLQSGNQNILGQAFDQAQSNMARLGRPNSSGLGAQFAQAGSQLAASQSPLMANYLGQLYGKITPNQYAGQYFGNQQQAQQNTFNWDLMNAQYQHQQTLQDQNIRQANNNQWAQLGGALIGAAGQIGGAAAGRGRAPSNYGQYLPPNSGGGQYYGNTGVGGLGGYGQTNMGGSFKF